MRDTGVEVVLAPMLSTATAVREWVPTGGLVQVKLYRGPVTSWPSTAPSA